MFSLKAIYLIGLIAVCVSASGGINVPIGTRVVQLDVGSVSSFRVSVSLNSNPPVRIDTPMVEANQTKATYTKVQPTPTSVGIRTAFGQIAIDSITAALTMWDSQGKIILQPQPLFPTSSLHNTKNTCTNVDTGMDCSGPQRTPGCPNGLRNQTQAQCCAACNADVNCQFWVMADAQHPDGGGMNCWLLQSISGLVPRVGRIMGAVKFPPAPPPPPPPPPQQILSLAQTSSAKFFGVGGRAGDPLTFTSGSAYVQNTMFQSPHYWSTDGYAALAVSGTQFDPNSFNNYQASWNSQGSATTWTLAGSNVDLYLMPAASMYDGSRVYWELIGQPVVPPKYAFGFLACRWGWQNANYIQSMLTQFRSGNYPVDAFISDFEWYTPQPDYSLPNTGSPTFQDFSYNNVTFPQPVQQLAYYFQNLSFRFGGIRKPRFGNSGLIQMALQNGWLVGQFGHPQTGGQPQTRNLNYSMPAVLDYYSQANAHYLNDGVDFWWNDEGETMYFTFYWWNVAETRTLQKFSPNKRFFTINRAYTPGMQRLGATIWTGDVQVSWQSMAQQVGYQLNWVLAGVGFVTCDIGGFNGPDTPPDLLTRWYQVGVFLGLMRVHSTLGNTPHFPFLYPTVNANAMRAALNLRYKLIPHHYSLAHQAYESGKPMFRPLVMEFPSDSNAVNVMDQWLSGDRLMVAPILTSQDGTDTDTQRQVYFPSTDVWTEIRWSTTGAAIAGQHQGPTTTTITNVGLDVIPTFLRAGSLLLVGPVIQYTDLQPGGPLQVIIAPGADTFFQMYEDDGESKDYQKGKVRITRFTWSDVSRTLSWQVISTDYAGGNIFKALQPTLIRGSNFVVAPTMSLNSFGNYTFSA